MTVATAAPPALEIRDVAVRFGGLTAVDVDRIVVHRGRIVGIIGPNGAGKTTLFDAISGFVSEGGGSVVLDGTRELRGLAPAERARLGLGRSFQNAALFEALTVFETVLVAHEAELGGCGPLSSGLRLPWSFSLEQSARARATELIDLMGLGAFHDKFISELSTGTRRIVDLAALVASGPSVLLLDEPGSGIAQREVEQLGALLHELRAALDCTMLVVEHDIPFVRGLSDELYAMETGRVIAHGTPEEVLSDSAVVESYLGAGTRAIERSGTTSAPAATADAPASREAVPLPIR